MKKFISIFFILLPFFLPAQNLIPNGGFEQYDTCPDNTAQITRALNWFNVQGTCDYFNICSTSIYVTPPNNTYGFQYPHTGNGFAGANPISCYQFTDIPIGLGRESLSIRFSEPLIENRKYCLEFYTVMGGISGIIMKNLGIYFSDTLIVTTQPLQNYTPQIEFNQLFYGDTINWQKMSAEYIAHGGEEYMLVGNFRDSLSAEIQVIDPLWGAYYFFDDFSLIECDSIVPTLPFLIPNTFTPDKNGINDVFEIQALPANSQLTVFNRWGNTVYQSNNYQNNWDGANCSDGVYYYIVNTADGKQYKGTVTILR
jgi:gliding motility-associated-like protein